MRLRATIAACVLLLAAPAARAQSPPADTLRIGLVLPDSAARTVEMRSAARGVEMGVEEARHAARLFGREVRLVTGSDAARLVSVDGVQALAGGFAVDECRALGELADARGVPWLNVGCADDALRGAGCHAAAFHVAPSAAMLADAAAGAGVPGGRAEAWDAALERFGADQLNQRYRARFGEPMDASAWAGWFAVKVVWESALRARSTDPAALRAWMARDAAQFDGHKGRPLSFRAWDHQLRQPLYVAGDGTAPPAEAPRAPPGAEADSRALLDQLGTPAARSECRW